MGLNMQVEGLALDGSFDSGSVVTRGTSGYVSTGAGRCIGVVVGDLQIFFWLLLLFC
jgi:hypothetical protein